MSTFAVENTSSPEDNVRSLIDITQSLSAIFQEENELLKSSRPMETASLQNEKARLAAEYTQAIKEVAADRRLVDGADTRLLQELRDITQTFEARAATQKQLIDAARRGRPAPVSAHGAAEKLRRKNG